MSQILSSLSAPFSKKFHKSPENWVVGPAGCLMPPTPSVETPRHDAVKLVGGADQEGTSILVSACTTVQHWN